MKNFKHILYVILGLAVVGLVVAMLLLAKQSNTLVNFATNFDECVANGNPVMESYPRQCRAENDTVFIEVIENSAIDQNIADEYSVNPENYPVIETVIVGPEKVDCVGVGPMSCLVVNGEYFYDQIDEFEHQSGYEYELQVEKSLVFGTTSPDMIPADAGIFTYKLEKIISQNPVFQAAGSNNDNKDTMTKKCVAAGCSSQLCVSSDNADMMTTCEFLPQYACYRTALCEVQQTGECGWTETKELQQCLQDPTNFEI